MGMLMHHTWLAEQKKKTTPKPAAEVKEEKAVEEPQEPATRKTVNRRKAIK